MVIIDWFKVFVKRPSNLLVRAKNFSTINTTIPHRCLLVSLQGSFSLVSEAWEHISDWQMWNFETVETQRFSIGRFTIKERRR